MCFLRTGDGIAAKFKAAYQACLEFMDVCAMFPLPCAQWAARPMLEYTAGWKTFQQYVV